MQEFTKEELESEIWRDVDGFEGEYQVSNIGRVRSLDRFAKHSIGKTKAKIKGRLLKPSYYKEGYTYCTLKDKKYKIHRLVAKAFIPNPYNKETVNHLDEVRDNNRMWNLIWFSVDEQNKYSKGTNTVIFYENVIHRFSSLSEASKSLGLDYDVVQRLSYEFNYTFKCMVDVLNTNQLALEEKAEPKFKKRGKSKYKGITIKEGKFYSRVSSKGKRYFVGSFETEKEAVVERDKFIVKNNINLPLQSKEPKLYSKNNLVKLWFIMKPSILNLSSVTNEFVETFEKNLLNKKL